MKKFSIYINEDIDSNHDTHEEMKADIVEMMKKSINSEDEALYKELVDSYQRDPESTNIEGFINESDIYDFYIKWRDDIDNILTDIKYYDEAPSTNNIFSLYNYVVEGTKKAFTEIVNTL